MGDQTSLLKASKNFNACLRSFDWLWL